MWYRCENPKANGWQNYGGRGVSVCERWREFSVFMADMGPKPSPKHSIDRIDPYGDYTPENCRWATALEQAANKRPVDWTKRPIIDAPGSRGELIRLLEIKYGSLRKAAKELGISHQRLMSLRSGARQSFIEALGRIQDYLKISDGEFWSRLVGED